MVKKILFQLELIAGAVQVNRMRKKNPSLIGIKMGTGFLWQHPMSNRQKILEIYRERLALDKDV